MPKSEKDYFIGLLFSYLRNIDWAEQDRLNDYVHHKLDEQTRREVTRILNNHSDFQILELLMEAKEIHYPGNKGLEELQSELHQFLTDEGSESGWEILLEHSLERLFKVS